MQIEYKNIDELIPYENNPRDNSLSIELVKNSIESFGFKVPIVIDKNNVIVAGHTRLEAAKLLELEEVPCIIADDLTEDQVKAFRLADNRVSEFSQWDESMLIVELDSLHDSFSMDQFGFNVDISPLEDEEEEAAPEQEEEKENERERTMDAYNLHDFDEERSMGFYQMPLIRKVNFIPQRLIGFNYVKSTPPELGVGVHFFIDDYQFERVWNSPHEYIPMLAEFDCVLTPDFSLYTEMPMAMKIWNVYRSRLIGQMLQDVGAVVIPTLSWCEPDTFQFCFDGIEAGGTVAISTIGVKREEEARAIWTAGVDEAMKRLQPKNVIVYGGDVGYKFPCNVVYTSNEVTERMKHNGNT